ncbi:MAG: tripartite tricarboxylate transporter TctB family protein [Trueperaceae bacterium]
MRNLLTPNRILGIGLVIACAVLWFAVVPVYAKGVDQSLFPRIAIAWIAICAGAIALLPALGVDHGPVGLDDEVAPVPPLASQAEGVLASLHDEAPVVRVEQGSGPLPSVYVVALVWGAYAVALGYLGFYLATWLMLVVSMAYLGIRSPRALAIRPVVTLVIVYLLLDRLLRFRLPEAFWQ